ncbi:Callose synthase 10 [Vitis vinifera]|uniref:Callose synthase 10 n=1 Tax=Vitis vinifera TaxID=29760 RepID=A0A438CTV1_VITVI|nr:Callose synthase 10 [Vitis vinifera]
MQLNIKFLYRVSKSHEAARNNNGKAAHSAWRNYDDFNEFFWSPACFELSWPMKRDSSFLLEPKGRKRVCSGDNF